MRRKNYFLSLLIAFALVASACSGSSDGNAATPTVTAPTAASPDAGQDLPITASPQVDTTTTTGVDRADAEQHVTDLIKTIQKKPDVPFPKSLLPEAALEAS